MSFTHHTPVEADGIRLFYRSHYDIRQGNVGGHYRGHAFIPPKSNDGKGLFRLLDPDNVMAVMRLYRWFHGEYERDIKRADGNFSGMIQKDDLMGQCFADWPSANKHRVGRLLRLIVPYETNFQNRSAKGGMFWRWSHPLDMIYGLEHLMFTWLPRVIEADGGTCSTDEEFKEELEIIRFQTKEEDHAFVDMILDKKLY